jgi:glutamine synthetase
VSEEFNRLRVLWPDHLGLARGKYVPASLAANGVRHCTGLWALGYDRQMTPETPGSHWNDGLPDLDATYDLDAIRPGWEPGTKVVVADLFDREGPVAVSPRGALRRAIAGWNELGYSPYVGMEFEAYLFTPDGKGGWQPLDTPGAYVYGTGPAVDPLGLLDAIWQACDAANIPLESVNSEYDTPQFEFTLRYADALTAADEGFLFKVLAREVAHRFGLLMTFMGKPMSDRGGSGLHFNMSLRDEDENNVINDPSTDDGISLLARQMVAGMLTHHQALAGVCAPTVNAYKRLRPASLSGYWANWGHDHRGATVRIPPERGAGARLEHRLSDGAAVVHSSLAAVLQAARLGRVNQLELGPAESGNGMDTIDATVGVPSTLSDALDALESDSELVTALGSELVAQHLAVKRAEWERYMSATTDWELREYLPFL